MSTNAQVRFGYLCQLLTATQLQDFLLSRDVLSAVVYNLILQNSKLATVVNEKLSNFLQTENEIKEPIISDKQTLDTIPHNLVGKIAEFSAQRDYAMLGCVNRSLHFGCYSPNMLTAIKLCFTRQSEKRLQLWFDHLRRLSCLPSPPKMFKNLRCVSVEDCASSTTSASVTECILKLSDCSKIKKFELDTLQFAKFLPLWCMCPNLEYVNIDDELVDDLGKLTKLKGIRMDNCLKEFLLNKANTQRTPKLNFLEVCEFQAGFLDLTLVEECNWGNLQQLKLHRQQTLHILPALLKTASNLKAIQLDTMVIANKQFFVGLLESCPHLEHIDWNIDQPCDDGETLLALRYFPEAIKQCKESKKSFKLSVRNLHPMETNDIISIILNVFKESVCAHIGEMMVVLQTKDDQMLSLLQQRLKSGGSCIEVNKIGNFVIVKSKECSQLPWGEETWYF